MDEPLIPRAQWKDHRNFPGQVLLLRSHQNFRDASRMLIAHTRAGESLDRVGEIYRKWMAAMSRHEHHEEHKIYPYLTMRWGISFDGARDGHHAIHVIDDDVRATLDNPVPTQRLHVVETLSRHRQVLLDHLRLEEDLVIPMLLELSPREFRRFVDSSADELLGSALQPG